MNRKIWAAIGGAAILAATALPAFAVEESVSATVTPVFIAVSIDDGVVNYGTLAVDTSQDTVTQGDTQAVKNDGTVAEDFLIRGQNSAAWVLAASAGDEEYKHEFTKTGTFGTALTTSNQSLDTNIALAGTTALDLKITTPTSTSASVTQTVDVTVVAVAN